MPGRAWFGTARFRICAARAPLAKARELCLAGRLGGHRRGNPGAGGQGYPVTGSQAGRARSYCVISAVWRSVSEMSSSPSSSRQRV
jgi:hypothetical protein